MTSRLKKFVQTEEFKTQAEWEASLGDEYIIRREVRDGVEVVVAYDVQNQVIGTYVLGNGREGGVNLESFEDSELDEAYAPADKAAFFSAVRKVANVLEVPWKHVYYRFTLDPRYYDTSYAEEDMLDKEFGLGVTDTRLWLDQAQAVKDAFDLNDAEAEAIFASERHWRDTFEVNTESARILDYAEWRQAVLKKYPDAVFQDDDGEPVPATGHAHGVGFTSAITPDSGRVGRFKQVVGRNPTAGGTIE